MKPLILDVETTRDAHPFNYDHKMFILGLYNGKESWILPIEWTPGEPYGHRIQEAQEIINGHDLLIAFNLKHDLLWCRRYGLKIQDIKLWCLQYAEFCLSGQTWRLPSLDTACQKRNLPGKIQYIKENFWERGLEINQAPWEKAEEYNSRDLEIEWALFREQVAFLKNHSGIKRLIWEGSQDLGITGEMEWNGIQYDSTLSLREGNKRLEEVAAAERRLRELVPIPQIKWTSPEHLSAVLYGGKIKYEERRPFTFTYADKNRGTATKYRKETLFIDLPRLVEPLHGSSLKKEGYFSTDEGILRRLKARGTAADIIQINLDIRGINKLVGTYYHGIPKLVREMNWQDGKIHGQLHHCVTQTGRLSSSGPNQQNLEYGVRQCLVTRFPLTTTIMEQETQT